MWETIKNALIGAKEAVGIEIPGLPEDLGSIGDSAATATQTITESATGAIDGAAAAATDAAGGSVADLTETVSGIPATAVDSATQALPDITGGSTGDSPVK